MAKAKASSLRATLAAAALPDKLRKRERAAMAMAYAMAYDSDAFSIAFDIKPRVVRTIIYLSQPKHEKQVDLEPEEDDDEEDDDMGDAPAPAMAGKRATNVKPPEPPPKPSTQAGGKKQPDLLAGNNKLPRTTLTPTASASHAITAQR